MTAPPVLTDRNALARNRMRARLLGPALFLQEDAADEIQERLLEVNRRFTSPVIVTPFPDVWHRRIPGARIIADDELLDLQPGAHDLVIHSLALHWANDPVGQLVQCRRALKSDGLFLGVTFAGRTLSELRSVLAEAEAALMRGLSLRVLPMGEIRDLGGLLQRAGFALPVADASIRVASYRDMLHLIHDLRQMGEGNALADRRHRPLPGRAFLNFAASLYAAAYQDADARIRATFEMIFLTGWAPDDNQQKPLRPGSALTRLADALDSAETPLSDAAPARSV
jgi:SAM-dependent methyltransferase